MSQRRINILIYAGPGTTPTSIRHATSTLRLLVGPNYAVLTLTADQLLYEPWPPTCALLVVPGGADLKYCATLNGAGNRRIRSYVESGGGYLGLCAGGYYGCGRCEFEVGKVREGMEVVGDRELGFFPGTCRGLAFGGFVYGSEAGARAVELKGSDGEDFMSYYNGGGVFVDATKFADKGVEVLAEYQDELDVNGGEGGAAVVYCRVGEGHVVLTGPHPEFAPTNLSPTHPTNPKYPQLISALKATDAKRTAFLKHILTKLGLEVNEEEDPVPAISTLHLSSSVEGAVSELLQSWHETGIVTKGEGAEDVVKCESDVFVLEQEGKRWSMSAVAKAVGDVLPESVKEAVGDAVTPSSTAKVDKSNSHPSSSDGPTTQSLRLVPHESSLPDSKETPSFNHAAYYSNLTAYNSKHRSESPGRWGQPLLYGEVVTSTSTMLEKNPTLLSHLPDGFTATATTQTSGRGRGGNVWVSPVGSLMFSTVLRHSIALSSSRAPVVFVQYLAALAIVAGIQNYDRGYAKLPVKLKWPNDIYALDPSKDPKEKAYVKIGGILVNSSYAGGDYTLVVGIGLNVNNNRPSTSLSQLAFHHNLPAFTLEKLLASILVHFEEIYTRFCRTGFDARLENTYYEHWLHADQIVTLEAEGGARARIKGITRDWGLLVAEELGWQDRATGRRWELQSDSNSFDFFKGLLKKKV